MCDDYIRPEKQQKRFVAKDALVAHIEDLEAKFESLQLSASKDAYIATLADQRGSVRLHITIPEGLKKRGGGKEEKKRREGEGVRRKEERRREPKR